MRSAKAAGTLARWRATWRICRLASQNRSARPMTRVAAKASVSSIEGEKSSEVGMCGEFRS